MSLASYRALLLDQSGYATDEMTQTLAKEVNELEKALFSIARACEIENVLSLSTEELAERCRAKINWSLDLLRKAEPVIKRRAEMPEGDQERVYLRNRKTFERAS